MDKQNSIFHSIRKMSEHSASLLLILLISADLVFIVIHVIYGWTHYHSSGTHFLDSNLLSITADHGYPEIYQYVKLFWLIILFSYLLISQKCYSYISWILMFSYFLFDDMLEIHEKMGEYIAKIFHFNAPLGFRLQDFGELTVTAIMGTILMIILLWAYLRGSHIFKKVSIDLLYLIGALVFFGVFVDMAHSAINFGPVMSYGWGIVEDGGEMVVVSLILWYVFLLALRDKDADLYLHDILRKAVTKMK